MHISFKFAIQHILTSELETLFDRLDTNFPKFELVSLFTLSFFQISLSACRTDCFSISLVCSSFFPHVSVNIQCINYPVSLGKHQGYHLGWIHNKDLPFLKHLVLNLVIFFYALALCSLVCFYTSVRHKLFAFAYEHKGEN